MKDTPTKGDRQKSKVTSQKYTHLRDEYASYNARLKLLASKPFLTEQEQLEEIRLKKLKLRVRDQMESLIPSAGGDILPGEFKKQPVEDVVKGTESSLTKPQEFKPSRNELKFDSMQKVNIEIPKELILAAGFNTSNLSVETARLLALELYREDKVSLGRASELCQMPVEQFMEFAAQHNVPLHYGVEELEEDRRTLERLGL